MDGAKGVFNVCWCQKYSYGWSVKSTGKFMAGFFFFIFVLKYKSNTSPYWRIWKSYNIKKRKMTTTDKPINKDKLSQILVDFFPIFLYMFIVNIEM